MAEITPGVFYGRMSPQERSALLRWLARHRLDPNQVHAVRHDAGSTVAEVVTYVHDREGQRTPDPDSGEALTKIEAIECFEDPPPIPERVR